MDQGYLNTVVENEEEKKRQEAAMLADTNISEEDRRRIKRRASNRESARRTRQKRTMKLKDYDERKAELQQAHESNLEQLNQTLQHYNEEVHLNHQLRGSLQAFRTANPDASAQVPPSVATIPPQIAPNIQPLAPATAGGGVAIPPPHVGYVVDEHGEALGGDGAEAWQPGLAQGYADLPVGTFVPRHLAAAGAGLPQPYDLLQHHGGGAASAGGGAAAAGADAGVQGTQHTHASPGMPGMPGADLVAAGVAAQGEAATGVPGDGAANLTGMIFNGVPQALVPGFATNVPADMNMAQWQNMNLPAMAPGMPPGVAMPPFHAAELLKQEPVAMPAPGTPGLHGVVAHGVPPPGSVTPGGTPPGAAPAASVLLPPARAGPPNENVAEGEVTGCGSAALPDAGDEGGSGTAHVPVPGGQRHNARGDSQEQPAVAIPMPGQ